MEIDAEPQGLDDAPQPQTLSIRFVLSDNRSIDLNFPIEILDSSQVLRSQYDELRKTDPSPTLTLDFSGCLVITPPSAAENLTADPIMSVVLKQQPIMDAYSRFQEKYSDKARLVQRETEVCRLVELWLRHYLGDMDRARRDLRCYNHTGAEKDQIPVKNDDFRMELANFAVADLFVQLNPVSLVIAINFTLKYDFRVLWHHACAALCSYNKNKTTQEIELSILTEQPAKAVAEPNPYLRVATDPYGAMGETYFTDVPATLSPELYQV